MKNTAPELIFTGWHIQKAKAPNRWKIWVPATTKAERWAGGVFDREGVQHSGTREGPRRELISASQAAFIVKQYEDQLKELQQG